MKKNKIFIALAVGIGAYLLWNLKRKQTPEEKANDIKNLPTEKVQEVIDKTEKEVDNKIQEQIKKEEKTERVVSQKELELQRQIDELKESITTKQQVQEIIDKKRELKLEANELKTLEDFIKDEQELIDRLTKTLDGIDTSTQHGRDRAKLYIDLIKKAEKRKLDKSTSKKTIIELGLGKTGYQQLLPQANYTLNDLLDDTKHIQITDRFNEKMLYEFYPVDADVELRQKGNWVLYSTYRGQKTFVKVLNPITEKATLGVVSRDPQRYEVKVANKSLDKK